MKNEKTNMQTVWIKKACFWGFRIELLPVITAIIHLNRRSVREAASIIFLRLQTPKNYRVKCNGNCCYNYQLFGKILIVKNTIY